jgi:hypothetical protein
VNKLYVIPYSMFIVIFMFCAMAYSVFGSYDKLGNRYSEYLDVIYYSVDGSEYLLSDGYYGECFYINIADASDRHKDTSAFVASNGTIIFDDTGTSFKKIESTDFFLDPQGERVRSTKYLSWNLLGAMRFD